MNHHGRQKLQMMLELVLDGFHNLMGGVDSQLWPHRDVDLSPQPVRKERNQPAFVEHTARFVAARRGISYEQLEQIVERNAAELFGW